LAPDAQDRRLAAVGAAAADVLRHTEYHRARAEDVAAAVHLPADSGDRRSSSGRRSAVWLHNVVSSRRVLVCLATYHAWSEYLARTKWTGPTDAPPTLTEACKVVVDALQEVARFHRAERFLVTQVSAGIGDIATTEKRAGRESPADPRWDPTEWGRIASAGWTGRCAAFADFLAPVLSAASEHVTVIAPEAAARSALSLSDLAFRVFNGDSETPVRQLALGLTAYWFERDLVEAAGEWVRDLYGAERVLSSAGRRAANLRAEAGAREALVWNLLDAGTLHARAAREARQLVGVLRNLTNWPADAPADWHSIKQAGEHTDLRALCDASSHLGYMLSRWGDLDAARAAYQLSREVAEHGVGLWDPHEAESFMLRSDHNLAEADQFAGRGAQAVAALEKVYAARRVYAEQPPARPGGAEWRRVSLTADARARAASAAGMVVQAVNNAEALVADRREQLGGTDNVNTMLARVTLGEALLAAAQPLEARRHLEEALQGLSARWVGPTAFEPQYCRTRLAQVALALGEPGRAVELLEPAATPVTTVWFATNVSFRLGLDAQRTLAMAVAGLGGSDGPRDPGEAGRRLQKDLREGSERLRSALAQLDSYPALGEADPLRLALWRDLAELLLRAGDAEAARRLLTAASAAEERSGDGYPQLARTLLLLARCADHLDSPRAARDCYQPISELANRGVDPWHQVLLAARYDQALRWVEAGDLERASALLQPLLDPRRLSHGRPALGDGHLLVADARSLAARIGMPQAPSTRHDHAWDTTGI
jgi:hypothetical protein